MLRDLARDFAKRKVEDLRWHLMPEELMVVLFTCENAIQALLDDVADLKAVTGEMTCGDTVLVERERP